MFVLLVSVKLTAQSDKVFHTYISTMNLRCIWT